MVASPVSEHGTVSDGYALSQRSDQYVSAQ